MVYTTKELLEKGYTEYSIRKSVKNGSLFLIEHGIYSDELNPHINEIYMCKKYPHAILTGFSSFYFYDLTDFVPDKFYFATEQHSFPIRRKDISQSYQDESTLYIGADKIQYDDGFIKIYDLERTLIELIRYKNKYPPELFYDVIKSFRKRREELDFYKINTYLRAFRNKTTILKRIKELI